MKRSDFTEGNRSAAVLRVLTCCCAALAALCLFAGCDADAAETGRKTPPAGKQSPSTDGARERRTEPLPPGRSCTLVTQPAPDFTAEAAMPDGTIEKITLSDFRGRYVILFFYPNDFSFVCPTELVAFDRRCDEFEERACSLLAVSVDSPYTHLAWQGTPLEAGGVGTLRYPMVSDITKSISRDYGVLAEEAVALRGLFLIDKEGMVRHCVINDMPLGRSVDEALRMVDALQFYEKNGELCPADWHKGDAGVTADKQGISEYLADK